MTNNIDIKSAAIILVKDEKALLQRRDNKPNISYPNCWGFAGGGKVNKNETYLHAAERELREETGYISKNPIFLMVAEYKTPDGKNVRAKRYFELYDNTQKLRCYEGQKIEFLTAKEINEVNTFPGVADAAKKSILQAKLQKSK